MSSLFVHIVAAWFAFLLPVFGTFKALSHRPVSEPELERWTKYWSVIGVVVAFEYLGEVFISWLPFFAEVKILFLLFLALPQTQGSTYVYDMYLQPFMATHEAELDADIVSIQRNLFSFAQAQLAAVWRIVSGAINKNATAGQQVAGTPAQSTTPGSGLNLDSAMGFLRSYGPSLMSSFQPAAGSAVPSPSPAATARTTSFQVPSSQPVSVASDVAPPFPEPQHA